MADGQSGSGAQRAPRYGRMGYAVRVTLVRGFMLDNQHKRVDSGVGKKQRRNASFFVRLSC